MTPEEEELRKLLTTYQQGEYIIQTLEIIDDSLVAAQRAGRKRLSAWLADLDESPVP